jgi:hypothetical protein
MAPRAPLLMIKKVLPRVALVVGSYTSRGDSDLPSTHSREQSRARSLEREILISKHSEFGIIELIILRK